MFNPFQMPNQMMQQKMFQQMQNQNPQLFNKVQEMMQGNGDHNLEKMFTNNKFYQYYPIAKQSLRLEK